ncbi:hypothetical protein VYU27_005763 [Nannochloropsis oceanica]
MMSTQAEIASSSPPSHCTQEQSTRVLWIGSRAAGTLMMQIQCCESFKGELLNSAAGDAHVDRTGLLLWPGSFLMCAYLLAARASLRKAGTLRHVVELGAGATGLAGSLLAHFSYERPSGSSSGISRPRVTLTDGDPESVALLSYNAKHHFRGGREMRLDGNNTTMSMAPYADIVVQRLRWGNQNEIKALGSGIDRTASFVLGSDILYPSIPPAVISQLLHSVRTLLTSGDELSNMQDTAQEKDAVKHMVKLKGRFVLSFLDRDNKATLRHLLLALREERFQIEEVVTGSDLFADEKEGFMVIEEEEEEEGEINCGDDEEDEGEEEGRKEGEGGEAGRGGFRGRHRRRVQMMGGGSVFVLFPLPLADIEDEAMSISALKASEARWFRDIWKVAPPEVEVEEWQAPLMSDDEEEENDVT